MMRHYHKNCIFNDAWTTFMSDTSYDCYKEKHFALHCLSGVKHVCKCFWNVITHLLSNIRQGFVCVCVLRELLQQHYSFMFIWVDLDSREFSFTMLPMCSDIFIRSTIYLLGVLGETDGVIYISTLCQYLDTDCDQVYRDEQGGCKICVHPSQGCYTRYSYWHLSDHLKSWHL